MKRKSSLPVLDSNPVLALVIDALLVISSPLFFAIGTWYITTALLNRLTNILGWTHVILFFNGTLGLLCYILTGASMYFVAKRHLIKQQWIFTMIIGSGFILLISIFLFSGWFIHSLFTTVGETFCSIVLNNASDKKTSDYLIHSDTVLPDKLMCTRIYEEFAPYHVYTNMEKEEGLPITNYTINNKHFSQ